MNETATTLATLAHEALSYFKRGKREAPGIGKILLTENPPEWVRNMCCDAHKEGITAMMPDDWRYEFIGDALNCIEDSEGDEDDISDRFREWFDGAYIYTTQRANWLASRAERSFIVDEAREEFGGEMDTTTSIWCGMMQEASEVLASVMTSLRERIEEMEESSDV